MATHTFYYQDQNGNQRELIAHYDFEPAEEETNFGAQVNIYAVEINYKGMKRDVTKLIPASEIERAEEEILEEEIN